MKLSHLLVWVFLGWSIHAGWRSWFPAKAVPGEVLMLSSDNFETAAVTEPVVLAWFMRPG